VWKTLVENENVQMYLEGDHLTIFYPVPCITDERLHIMNQVYRRHSKFNNIEIVKAKINSSFDFDLIVDSLSRESLK
jgi:hypothetical protein